MNKDSNRKGKTMIYLHLKTKNDNNGNPRRLYLVINDNGGVVEAIDEGYSGDQVARKYPQIIQGPPINITPTEYRDWLRHYGGVVKTRRSSQNLHKAYQ